MSLKNIFKAASITLRKYKNVLIPVCFVLGVILFVAYIGGSLLFGSGLGIVFTTILVFPCLVGIKYLAKKCVLRDDARRNDFYFGFRNFFISNRIELSTLLGGILLFVLGFALSTSICGTIYALVESKAHPEILTSLINFDSEGLSNAFNAIPGFANFLNFLAIPGVIVGSILFIWKGMNKHFICYITFDAPFTVDVCNSLSISFSKRNNKKLFLLNLIFILFADLLFVVSFFLNTLINSLGLHDLLGLSISSFIFFILSSLILMYYVLCTYHTYNHYLRNEVLSKFEALKKQLDEIKKNQNF